jgi:hypothetical protein
MQLRPIFSSLVAFWGPASFPPLSWKLLIDDLQREIQWLANHTATFAGEFKKSQAGLYGFVSYPAIQPTSSGFMHLRRRFPIGATRSVWSLLCYPPACSAGAARRKPPRGTWQPGKNLLLSQRLSTVETFPFERLTR